FAISFWHLPILRSLQQPDGLWTFGGDGLGYHEFTVKLLNAWHDQVDLPSVFTLDGINRYDLYTNMTPFLAVVYGFAGASPLHYILVNRWLSSICGVVAYLLLLRLQSDKRAALAAAVLIGFWPSSLIWSTQLLKDPLVLALVLCTLYSLVSIWVA